MYLLSLVLGITQYKLQIVLYEQLGIYGLSLLGLLATYALVGFLKTLAYTTNLALLR